MHSTWLEHLRSSGAAVKGAEILGFGDRSRVLREPHLATSETVAAPLIERGSLLVTGADAEKFLQAQLTSDLQLATPSLSQLSAYCTPQGRMIASFRLLRAEEGFLLSLPREVLPRIEEKLTYFRIRAQVTFEDVSDGLAHIGLSGRATEAALARADLSLPREVNEVSVRERIHVIRIPDDGVRVEIIAPVSRAPALWDVLTGTPVEPVGPSAWSLLDVRAGLPWIFEATSEAFVPQMANLHALGGVSFAKGCFPGQEIVARLRYRGTLKRRMYKLRTSSTKRPSPGDAVLASSERAVGKVVTAAPSTEEGYELLAVLVIGEAERDGAELTLASGAVVSLETLPYDVEMAFDREA